MAIHAPTLSNRQIMEQKFTDIGAFQLEVQFAAPVLGSQIIAALQELYPRDPRTNEAMAEGFHVFHGTLDSTPCLIGRASIFEHFNALVVAPGENPFIDSRESYPSVIVKSIANGPGQDYGYGPRDTIRAGSVDRIATALDAKFGSA